MGMDYDAAELPKELRRASENISQGDRATAKRLGDQEDGINEIHRRLNRPGAEGYTPGAELERKDARIMCEDRHFWGQQ